MEKIRAYELSKIFGFPSKNIVNVLHEYGVSTKNHMSALSEYELDVIFEYYTQKNQAKDFSIFDKKKEEPKDENLQIITSPMVGTFYSSDAPDKPAYVKVGDKIHKGQVVCIVEAMKLMNEIESEFDGEVVEVCAKNEEMVEYGAPLFKIKA